MLLQRLPPTLNLKLNDVAAPFSAQAAHGSTICLERWCLMFEIETGENQGASSNDDLSPPEAIPEKLAGL